MRRSAKELLLKRTPVAVELLPVHARKKFSEPFPFGFRWHVSYCARVVKDGLVLESMCNVQRKCLLITTVLSVQ